MTLSYFKILNRTNIHNFATHFFKFVIEPPQTKIIDFY